MMLAALFTVVVLIGSATTTSSNKLWPYGKEQGDRVLDKTTVSRYEVSPKSVVFEMDEKIKWFDNKDVTKIKIFENGLITRNIWYRAPLCPNNVRKGFYLSAFWVPTDIRKSGTVYYRQEKPKSGSSSTTGMDYEALVNEIRSSAETLGSDDFYTADDEKKKSTLTVGDVRSVVVITWEKMVQPTSIFANPKHSNTFQLVLVSTNKGTYAHFVFAKIDYFHFVSRYTYCTRGATTALTESSRYHFEMTSFFYLDSSNIQLHSNIPDFTKMGRYVMILRRVKYQPSPPRLKCSLEKPSQFCRTGLPENFCQNKPTGRYKHPSFCGKFVLCNGGTADVQNCGNMLVYNPWIQNCDWPHSYRCRDTDFPHMMRMFETQMRLGRFNSEVSIRYDRINLRFSTHNNTCVGVPQWGNTVDISSCEHYLMCSNTRTFIVPCPPSHNGEKLFFNPNKNYCDYQRNVQCENGKRPDNQINNGKPIIITPPPQITSHSTTDPPSLPPNMNPCRNTKSGNRPDPFSCEHYYSCQQNGVVQRSRCPASWNGVHLYYNPHKDECVYKEEMRCVPLTMPRMPMNGKD